MTIGEVREADAWRLIAIREALSLFDDSALRCIECHGAVRVVSDDRAGRAAHFKHVRRHSGCSKTGRGFAGVKTPHPDALT